MNLHLKEAEKYHEFIKQASIRYGFQESVIAGIGSRESAWGLLLKPRGHEGTGDFTPRKRTRKHRRSSMPPDGLGFGRGLMQIDYDYHEFARTGNWRDPENNILYSVELIRKYELIIARRTGLQGKEFLKAVISSYNAGPGNIIRAIKNNLTIDSVTTGCDYSNDVLNRAGFFQLHGWR